RNERRADIANVRDPRNVGDDVRDRGVEGGVTETRGATLDQDVLRRRLLEAVLEDPVHAAGLARPTGAVDVPRSDHPTETEGDEHEREPAEGCGLPVGCAPAAHAGGEVARVSGFRGHDSS